MNLRDIVPQIQITMKLIMANEITKTSDNIEDLFNKVSGLIEQARSYVKTSVNTTEVYTKYYIGKYGV